jgi:heterodisulfide reductase subunit A
MAGKQVLIIGGGVAGLSAAIELAQLDVDVQVVDPADFMGGHAIRYTCKATDQCVKCGACMVEDKLAQAVAHPRIHLATGSRVHNLSKNGRLRATITQKPRYIDPDKCTGCGFCLNECPADGAISEGFSSHHHPFFTINEDHCRYVKDGSCTICRDRCPESAIDLDRSSQSIESHPDAIVVATGFTPFDPTSKPYGYGTFKNVVTNLELEQMLRHSGQVKRPSDGKEANRIAFVQCVGSRDAKLGHLWCSKVCCGSALRMARVIKSRQAEAEITFFYIDVQTFGKDFDQFYRVVQDDVQLVRSIPGDVYPSEGDQLKMIFADSHTHESREEIFDLIVLSVGMTPCSGIQKETELLNLSLADSGFINNPDPATSSAGVFVAGAAKGPMSISESITDAGKAAWEVLNYLGIDRGDDQ